MADGQLIVQPVFDLKSTAYEDMLHENIEYCIYYPAQLYTKYRLKYPGWQTNSLY